MIGIIKTVSLALLGTLATLSVLNGASGQDETRSKYELLRERAARIHQSRPKRREFPLREANISDREVKEVLVAAKQVFPGSVINISGVTAGCPCQDQPHCSGQVWIVAHQETRTNGLMLSRIDQLWVVGPLQQWWLAYDDNRAQMIRVLRAREAGFGVSYRRLLEQQMELQDAFPLCLDSRIVGARF